MTGTRLYQVIIATAFQWVFHVSLVLSTQYSVVLGTPPVLSRGVLIMPLNEGILRLTRLGDSDSHHV